MLCPRCTASELIERDHDGVTVDVCRECRGLWLDRGELEKLVARATRDMDELAEGRLPRRQAAGYAPPPPGFAPPHRGRDDSSGDYDLRYHDDRRRRRKWYESLGDIFD